MGLTSGTRLGAYEIVSPIGAGGMGEVYRARDTKLDRDVAIKVLPPHLASDPEALVRFEREAKAVAALSHPNILSIHDFGRDDGSGVSYAAMELLEGATLRERLATGPLPPKKVVQIGVDIAQGLAAAHARGIVHRDLKPENVFVTSDGRVKILDFGLARPMPLSGDLTSSPTALQQTNPGTVLGTVGYMSPEQVKGLAADHRADIFSLGCVLYELSTGRRAFQRETAAETMTAILREDAPDLPRDSGASPAAIEPVIRHCLEKQPDERFQSARDLAFALHALSSTTTVIGSGAHASASPVVSAKRALPIVPIAAALVLVAAAFFAGRALAPGRSAAQPPITFNRLTDDAGAEIDPAISPDGVSVAFARETQGRSAIYVQRIGGRNPIVIAGDLERSKRAPAFSPDGASIAFHVSGDTGGIFVAGATGESARRVTDFGFHPAWSPDGRQLAFCTEEVTFAESRTTVSTLWVVDAKGGVPRKINDGDAVQPAWSPSGRRLVYWSAQKGQRDIFTMSVDGGSRVAVTNDAALDWSPIWSADGHFLYFASDRGGAMNIWRIAIDEASGKADGAPEPVTSGVTTADQPTLSKDGAKLLFRSSAKDSNPASIPFDPVTEKAGAPHQILDRTGNLIVSSASPDGQWLTLFNMFEHQEDIFIVHPDGTGLRRLTDDAFRDRWPVWSSDSREVAFYSNRSGNYGVWAVKPDGSGLRPLTEEPAAPANNLLFPMYSPQGDRMVASRFTTPGAFLFDLRRPWSMQTPQPVTTQLPDGSWINPTQWSPDGRYLAGAISSPSGSSAGIGVVDVAAQTARVVYTGQVTGVSSVWLADSKRLVFLSGDSVWVLDVDTGRRRLVVSSVGLGVGLAVSADRRTLYLNLSRQQADVWMADLKGKQP